MTRNVSIYTAVITCANEIITLAWFATGTEGSAPNIIDFPSYRVIFLRSLSEQYYGVHRATNGEAATGTHLQRGARTCLTN